MPSDYLRLLRKYETAPDDTVIRRYLSAEKFGDFVKTWQLRFAPASHFLGDPEEGYFTVQDQAAREATLRRAQFCDKGMNLARKAWDNICRSNAGTVVISCWVLGEAENARMWIEYGKTQDAVAVETTVGALRSVLGDGVLAAPIRYIDRLTARLPETHPLEPYLFKGREDFEWENELRFVTNMEIGRRIGKPRLFALPPAIVPMRFIVAPNAPPTRRDQVLEMIGPHASNVEVALSALHGSTFS